MVVIPTARNSPSGAGAARDRDLSTAQLLPLTEAFVGSQSAVQNRKPIPEARAQTPEDLVGQGDLRNQHQGLPARLQTLGDRPKVDLGLAAPGHAV